ncbi:hypothetical protein BGZ65_010028 [Modicella reniformis]|uniref:Uncharacterized protein n=1 Tax=Modicella reniformis TaxID=1440133 RepID=A0A9P6MKH0_9FUNG|nr:hypothetical protein BGZ65_010028 [Modicella reniformis]
MTAPATSMTSASNETSKDNILATKLSSKEDTDSSPKDETSYLADNRQESASKRMSRQEEYLFNRSITLDSTNTEMHATTGSIEDRSSEFKTQHGASRNDDRSDYKRTAERNNTSGNNNRSNQEYASSSKHQDRISNGHRNDRNRPQPNESGQDKADVRERPVGGGREGDKDGAKDKERRSRTQDQRHKDNRQQSHAPRHNQGRDKNAKDLDQKEKNMQQRDKQGNVGSEVRPDPLSLLSITGRMGSLTPQKPFFGNSRVVDDFEKLNKIGEGTYGVV